MENYEQKYKDALSWMKDLYPTFEGATKEDVEHYFPELKESEDERMRKECISIIDAWDKSCRLQGDCCEVAPKCIAWLEKQGEQKSKKVSLWKHWKDGIAGNEEGKLTYLIKIGNTYFLTSCLGFECDYIELSELDSLTLEKQCEQKLTDKVEPKFKVGDIVINKNSKDTVKIVQILHDSYHYSGWDGVATVHSDFSISEQDNWELVEQKPNWSEEDEDNYVTALWHIKRSSGREGTVYNWLKSIKERMKGE